jgi:Glycosyltransferase
VPEVAIFRNNLFRISEPFITQQAGSLRRYQPFYLGRLRFGEAPPGACALALSDLGGPARWLRVGAQMLTRAPAPYQRLLGSRRPDLIHAHFGIDGVYALPLAQRLGVPLVTTFHGYDATLATARLLLSPAWCNYPLFRGRLARDGDLFLCVSEFIRGKVLALGFPEERTQVHHIGVDHRHIRPREHAEETPTILHVGRLVEMKGTEYLIRAYARLRASTRTEARLVIIGDGALRKSLQALVRELSLTDQVRFLGAQPHAEVMRWMRRALMLVLPSVNCGDGRAEGLGMVLLEAAATGVPLIGSRVGGIPEVVEHGSNGLLAAERDVAALAEHMAHLLGDAETRRRMGAAGRQRVLQHFDLRHQTARLEDLYDELRQRRREPATG